jgi:sulfite oxidase
MAAASLRIREQTIRDETSGTSTPTEPTSGLTTPTPHEDANAIFAEERPGWKGYIEWERYPEKKEKARAILAKHKFPPPPEFQLGPIPDTNPVLEGVRWKMWHKAIGGPLATVPEESWLRVVQEKHKDMLHLLQFPYNGEGPKVWLSFDCHVYLLYAMLHEFIQAQKGRTNNPSAS